ncbi:MAG: hypothetical protein ABII27_08165 [bacterium]
MKKIAAIITSICLLNTCTVFSADTLTPPGISEIKNAAAFEKDEYLTKLVQKYQKNRKISELINESLVTINIAGYSTLIAMYFLGYYPWIPALIIIIAANLIMSYMYIKYHAFEFLENSEFVPHKEREQNLNKLASVLKENTVDIREAYDNMVSDVVFGGTLEKLVNKMQIDIWIIDDRSILFKKYFTLINKYLMQAHYRITPQRLYTKKRGMLMKEAKMIKFNRLNGNIFNLYKTHRIWERTNLKDFLETEIGTSLNYKYFANNFSELFERGATIVKSGSSIITLGNYNKSALIITDKGELLPSEISNKVYENQVDTGLLRHIQSVGQVLFDYYVIPFKKRRKLEEYLDLGRNKMWFFNRPIPTIVFEPTPPNKIKGTIFMPHINDDNGIDYSHEEIIITLQPGIKNKNRDLFKHPAKNDMLMHKST